jgi:hypothetical protein
MKRVLAALLFAAAATPAVPSAVWAQVAGPSPDQILAKQLANQNRFQAQLQADQLDQLQRRNRANLQQSDPNLQAQAAIRQHEIQQQIDQNEALRQQMLTPGVDPGDVRARLQQNNAQIQRLEQAPPPIP